MVKLLGDRDAIDQRYSLFLSKAAPIKTRSVIGLKASLNMGIALLSGPQTGDHCGRDPQSLKAIGKAWVSTQAFAAIEWVSSQLPSVAGEFQEEKEA